MFPIRPAKEHFILGSTSIFHPDLDSLINGNELFNSDLNSQILFQVFKFIKETRRFSL